MKASPEMREEIERLAKLIRQGFIRIHKERERQGVKPGEPLLNLKLPEGDGNA